MKKDYIDQDTARYRRHELAKREVKTIFRIRERVTLAEIQRIAYDYQISLRAVNEMLYELEQEKNRMLDF